MWLLHMGLALLVSACGGGGAGTQSAQNPSNFDALYFNETPVIAVVPQISEESFHVEYPTMYRVGRGFAMLYSAIGDDFRWRIKLAYSSDGVNWVGWGNIFDESVIPFDRRYAFPYVTMNSSGVFEAYFAVEPSGGLTYTEMWKSTSSDGFLWSAPQLQFSDNMVLDPVVLDSGRRILYTSRNNLNQDVVKQRVLGAQGWGPVQVVYAPLSGIYTLGNFLYRGKILLWSRAISIGVRNALTLRGC